MRRLIDHLRRAREVHRANGERGAVAVMTAVALVVLLFFAALAIDVGLMYEERAQLQSSADAAALALAQDCAAGDPCQPDTMLARAEQYATANVRDATVDVDQPVKTGNKVKVAVHSLDSDGAGSLALNFGFVTGREEAAVGATATASWAAPSRGPAILPIIISRCDFNLESGPQLIHMHGKGKNALTSASNQVLGTVEVLPASNRMAMIPIANDNGNNNNGHNNGHNDSSHNTACHIFCQQLLFK